MTDFSRWARIGMIIRPSNTAAELITSRLLGGRGGVSVHFARLPAAPAETVPVEATPDEAAAMVTAARQLAEAQVDLIVWNGTSGAWLGIEQDRAIVASIESATGIPATTTTLALLDACAAFGVERLGLVTPYTGDVNAQIVATCAAAGITIGGEDHLGITDNASFGRVDPAEVARQVRRVASGADAVAVVCTNVHGAVVVPELEAELGIPVLDSVAVTLWGALRIVGVEDAVPDAGRLFADGFLHARLHDICRGLLVATGADRTTVRLDLPDHHLSVQTAAAESRHPGVRAIRHDASIDQRALDTVRWLEQQRRNLVQPTVAGPPPLPPALVTGYGVRAQMLGPVEAAGAMVGWVSVHSSTPRNWTTADVETLDRARAQVVRAALRPEPVGVPESRA